MLEWVQYGPNAILLRFAEKVDEEGFRRGRALVTALEEHPLPGLIEYAPAFTTVLLEFEPRAWPEIRSDLSKWLARLEQAAIQDLVPPPVKPVDVVYDGPDLGRVAKLSKLSVDEVIRLHSAPVYKVYCLGFAPGFPYLGDLDPRLHTPRLDSPRTHVSPGSVAIGGEHTGIYPVESPGGWNIIGHTSVRLFDPERRGSRGQLEGMFYLRQGDRVQFVAQDH